MRYAILSDVHASIEALSAVLDDARAEGAERLVCLGDIVGYHADPDDCIALLRARDPVCVAGNHDRVAAGIAEPRHFGDVARRAALWTRGRLSAESRDYLRALPLAAVVDGAFLVVHAALHPRPNADLHLSSDARVRRSMKAFAGGPWGVRLGFFGHTHRAVVHAWREVEGGVRSTAPAGDAIELDPGCFHLVNPGSVGQPRDGDPRASYALLDVEARRLSVRRVPYDVEACLAKAARAGLLAPEAPRRWGLLAALARRLS